LWGKLGRCFWLVFYYSIITFFCRERKQKYVLVGAADFFIKFPATFGHSLIDTSSFWKSFVVALVSFKKIGRIDKDYHKSFP
jgi:hypothetical protein